MGSPAVCFLMGFANQFPEDGDAFENLLIGNAVAQPAVAGAAEVLSRDDEQVLFLCPLAEGLTVSFRGLYEQVKGALGLCHLIPGRHQSLIKGTAVFVVAI